MTTTISFHQKIDTSNYSVLAPIPPFVDIILKNSGVTETEFPKIVKLVSEYQNDTRLVEMVRQAGDASAKVPYLLEDGITADNILTELRTVAHPHIERLKTLPEKIQVTIHSLLSLNQLPSGLDEFGIPALLELDRIQKEMILELRKKMIGRRLAAEFIQANARALACIDEDWPHLQKKRIPYWPDRLSIPKKATMQYEPIFHEHNLKYVYETCVIVKPPWEKEFRTFVPPVLRRPLEEKSIVPATGSADWLIREVGEVGRHITRALLELIREHLEKEKITLEAKNYEIINQEAREALEEYIGRMP
jgi:hypothetical protein